MDIIEKDAKELLGNLDNPSLEEEANDISVQSQSDLLRNTTFSFLQRQMATIGGYETVIANALSLLNERILAKELDVESTLKVVNSLSSQVTGKTSVLLEPFKAAPQSSSPLIPPARQESESDLDRGLKDLSSDELKTLEKFYRAVSYDKN